MNYLYAKYKYSNKIKLLRMVAVIAVAIVCFAVGGVRIFGHNPDAGAGFVGFSWFVLIVVGVLVVVVGYLEIYRDIKIEKIYPVIALTLGIVYIALIPAFETPDEQEHFGSAYNRSNLILGIGNPHEDGVVENGFVPYRYMRDEDASVNSADITTRINSESYSIIFDNMEGIGSSDDDKVIAVNYSSNMGSVIYFLPALGITIARLLHMGFGYEYILGALLNMLFYVAMTTYAINKIPVGKRVLFVISLLPITLQQISSYSYDCGLIACIMVVVAQAFFLRYGDVSTRKKWKWNYEIPVIRTTITELLMYILCGVLIYSVKSGVFLVVMLLPFALCINKKWFQGRNRIISILVICIVAVSIGSYIVFLGGYSRIMGFLSSVPQNVREIYGQTGVAPVYYISNPGRFFGIVYESLKQNLGHYIAQIGGTALGYNRIFITKMVYIVNLIFLLASLIRYNKEEDVFGFGNRILAFLIGIIPVLITVLAMLLYWTLPTDTVIMGFQGRYIIPTLSIIMLSLGRWKKIRIPDIDNIFIMLMTFSSYACCISVLSYV